MRQLWLLCILIFFVRGSFAQVVHDSAHIEVRSFNAKQIAAYKADRDFQYDLLDEPSSSAWDRFWIWFWHKVMEVMGTPAGAATVKTVLFLIATGLIVLFIWNLSGMNKAGLWSKKNTGTGFSFTVSDEDIHAIDFARTLQQAVLDGNYRLAIRLLYLHSLKQLSDRQLINWQINKTNTAYIDELKDPALRQSFYRLTRQFESNWYGNVPIREQEFVQVRAQFEQFNQQLT